MLSPMGTEPSQVLASLRALPSQRTGIDIAIVVKEEVKDLMAKALAEYFKGE